jgi:Zn-dependent protease with chaperone function
MKLILFILTFVVLTATAQQTYKPLVSEGNPPEHLMKSIQENVKETELVLSPYESKETRLLEYALNGASYHKISEMLGSGNILYGDATYEYLQSLMKTILKKNKLNYPVKVHAFKSSYTNAFATDIGYIFVNLGLLSKIETEAELAYVLCHELAHYVLRHSLEGELVKYDESNLSEKKVVTAYDKLIQKHLFSQKFELQADSLGLKYYLEAGYKPSSVEKAFNILKDLHYTLHKDVDLNQYFNYDNAIASIDEDVFNKTLDKVTFTKKKFNDKFATHPEIEARVEKLEKYLPEKDKGKTSLANKKLYKEAIKAADLENLRVALIEGNYLDAIYYAGKASKDTKFEEYAHIGFIRANIGLFLSKIYDPNLNPRFHYTTGLTDIKLLSDSKLMPILMYYRCASYQELADKIAVMISDGLKAFPESAELISINNWFIDWSNNEGQIEITDYKLNDELKKQELKEGTYNYEKKIFIDPNFVVADMRGKPSVDFIKTEKVKTKVAKYATKESKNDDQFVNLGIFDKKNFTTENFNQAGIINNRIQEILASPMENIPPPVDYYTLQEICTNYETERVIYANGIAIKDLRNPLGIFILYYMVYTAPLAVVLDNIPTAYSYMEYQDVDLLNGKASEPYSLITKGYPKKPEFKQIYTP